MIDPSTRGNSETALLEALTTLGDLMVISGANTFQIGRHADPPDGDGTWYASVGTATLRITTEGNPDPVMTARSLSAKLSGRSPGPCRQDVGQ